MPAIVATKQLLAEARQAYHALMTGTMARVVVDVSGERVEFSPANAQRLYNYIMELERQLAVQSGSSVIPNNGPATFFF